MLETQVQAWVKQQLERRGWWVVKLIQCSVNGLPDLMALKEGRTLFIEVKRPGAKPAPLQTLRHQQLTKAGFVCLVIDDKCLKQLENI